MEGIPTGQPNKENLHALSEERKVLRKAKKEAPGWLKEEAEEGISEINEKLSTFSIEGEGGFSAAKKRLLEDKKLSEKEQKHFDRNLVLESFGEDSETLQSIIATTDDYEDIRDFEMRRALEKKSDPYAKEAHERLLVRARAEKESLKEKLEDFEREEPVLARAHELLRDAEGLIQEGHIAPVASVR